MGVDFYFYDRNFEDEDEDDSLSLRVVRQGRTQT